MLQFSAETLNGDKPPENVESTSRLFHVRLHRELTDLLDRFAASQNVTAETIIAESVRAYLGADA